MPYMTTGELAASEGTNEPFVTRLVRHGKIQRPKHREGRKFLWDKAEQDKARPVIRAWLSPTKRAS